MSLCHDIHTGVYLYSPVHVYIYIYIYTHHYFPSLMNTLRYPPVFGLLKVHITYRLPSGVIKRRWKLPPFFQQSISVSFGNFPASDARWQRIPVGPLESSLDLVESTAPIIQREADPGPGCLHLPARRSGTLRRWRCLGGYQGTAGRTMGPWCADGEGKSSQGDGFSGGLCEFTDTCMDMYSIVSIYR